MSKEGIAKGEFSGIYGFVEENFGERTFRTDCQFDVTYLYNVVEQPLLYDFIYEGLYIRIHAILLLCNFKTLV